MDKNELIRQLMTVFLEELHEHVTELNSGLLALEKDPSGEQRHEHLKGLFRAAHSLKGAAGSVNVDLIKGTCHHLETVLTAVRDDRLAMTPELFTLLFKTVDAMDEAGARLHEDQELAGGRLESLLQELEQSAQPFADPVEQAASLLLEPASGAADPVGQAAGPVLDAHCIWEKDATPARLSSPKSTLPASGEGAKQSGDAAKQSGEGAKESVEAAAKQSVDAAKVFPPPARGGIEGGPARHLQTASCTPASLPSKQASAAAESAPPKPVTKPAVAVAGSAVATVRVPAEKLDSLMALSSELLVSRRRLEFRIPELATLRDHIAAWRNEWSGLEKPLRRLLDGKQAAPTNGHVPLFPRRSLTALKQTGERLQKLEKDLDQLAGHLVAGGRMLAQTCDALDGAVHRVRMLPFAEACGGLERAARDVARVGGKDVQLVLAGEDVELDRSVLEGLKDPLLHLVRNAVDHGIESPSERKAAGKQPGGIITVSAALRGTHVEVAVADDGRGLDLEKIRERGRHRGLSAPQDDRDLARMIFLPGFSTASIITDVSGRGVGLDVVVNKIESLHGAVNISFEPGRGCCFTLIVPLTLTTIRTVLVAAGGQTFALATANVRQLVRFGVEDVRSLGGHEVLLHAGAPIPVASLAETLGLPCPVANGNKHLGVILATAEQRVVFVVDDVLAEQDIVVKNLGTRIKRLRHVSGATLLPSGRVALVLNVANLVRTALGRAGAQAVLTRVAASVADAKKRLLVVEDSLTTRMLLKSILEAAGYDVTVAVDGQQALQMLPEAGVDLVVTDVDMPRLDGFALTKAIRGSKSLAQLPVVLVTARESDEDRTRGIEAGANAYLVKSGFDQRSLLEAVAQLV